MKKQKIERYYKKSIELEEIKKSIEKTEQKKDSLEKIIGEKEIKRQKIENALKQVNDLVYCKKCKKVYHIPTLLQQGYIERRASDCSGPDGSSDSDYVPWVIYKCKKCSSFLAKKYSPSLASQDELERGWDIQHAVRLNLMFRNIKNKEPDVNELKKIS